MNSHCRAQSYTIFIVGINKLLYFVTITPPVDQLPTYSQTANPVPKLCEMFASIKTRLGYVLCSSATHAPVECILLQSRRLMWPNRDL